MQDEAGEEEVDWANTSRDWRADLQRYDHPNVPCTTSYCSVGLILAEQRVDVYLCVTHTRPIYIQALCCFLCSQLIGGIFSSGVDGGPGGGPWKRRCFSNV